IPANNVVDTRWNARWHDPLLSSAEVAAMARDLAEAEDRLRCEDYVEAAARARRVIDRDPALGARALQIAALSALAAGEGEEARRCFGEMEDARLYLPRPGLLTCGPALAAAIGASAAAEGMA